MAFKKIWAVAAAKKIIRSKHHAVVFLLAFAITGAVILLLPTQAAVLYAPNPPHASACVENTPSKNVVRPGENFTARIRIQNTGSSTFDSNFGIALAEYTDGPSIWNASGTYLSGPVGPGGIAEFNLGVKAPGTPGVYNFNWGMAIVFTGYITNPCTGRTVTVATAPDVSLQANNQNNNITLTRGNSLNLTWSATNGPTACTASGNWNGAKGAIGNENRDGDANSAGTKTYSLACSNAAGGNSVSRIVTVNNPPVTPNIPPAIPNTPSTPASPSKPPTKSTPKPTKTNTNTIPPKVAPAITIPPSAPNAFSSQVVDNSVIKLTWEKPTYDGILLGYELDKSTDKSTWNPVGEALITAETITDKDVKFETTYFYRLRAAGSGDLKSEYVQTEVTTSQFSSNTKGEVLLVSEDQRVEVSIPDSAIDEDASCNLQNNNELLPPSKEKYESYIGPYQILCKKNDGTIIKAFNSPLTVTINAKGSGYKKLSYFSFGTDWQETEGTFKKNVGKFEIKDQTSFAVLGQKGSTPLIVKLLIGLIVFGVVVILCIRILRFIRSRQDQNAIQKQNDDYYHKEHGV